MLDSKLCFKIAGININNLRYADDNILMGESKEKEEKNRMGKIRDLFKKTRDMGGGGGGGIFHAKMGTIKDRNDIDLTEAEDIKSNNTQKNYTKKIPS